MTHHSETIFVKIGVHLNLTTNFEVLLILKNFLIDVFNGCSSN